MFQSTPGMCRKPFRSAMAFNREEQVAMLKKSKEIGDRLERKKKKMEPVMKERKKEKKKERKKERNMMRINKSSERKKE